MDGLAAGVASIAAICYLTLLLPGNSSAMTVAVAAFTGAVLGFLLFNFPPGSIFMGDSGSLLLGGFLATVGLGSTVRRAEPADAGGALPRADPDRADPRHRLRDLHAAAFRAAARSPAAAITRRTGWSRSASASARPSSRSTRWPPAAARWRSCCACCRSARSSRFVTLYLLIVAAAVLVLAAQGRDLPAVADLAYRRRALELLVDLGVLDDRLLRVVPDAFSRRRRARRSSRRSSRRSR